MERAVEGGGGVSNPLPNISESTFLKKHRKNPLN